MPAKTPTHKSLAEALCRECPDAPNQTLARRLYEENKSRFSNVDAARSAIRRVRGNYGNKERQYATQERRNGKAGWKPECPPSSAEPWEPVRIDGPCRALILSDTHIPYHSKEALDAAVKHGKKLKPDVVVINGDYMDFHTVSFWMKDPKKRDIVYECQIGDHGLSWLRGQFPKARFIYKLGNHEERLTKYIWQKCPELYGLEGLELHNVLHFEDYSIERVNDNPILCGKLPILHGHEAGKGISAPVNPARGLFLKTLHSCLEGHYHRTSTHCEPDMFKSETTTWSQGCLCDMSPEYARVNKWNLGFAYVEVDKDGEYNVHNYRLSSDYKVRTA